MNYSVLGQLKDCFTELQMKPFYYHISVQAKEISFHILEEELFHWSTKILHYSHLYPWTWSQVEFSAHTCTTSLHAVGHCRCQLPTSSSTIRQVPCGEPGLREPLLPSVVLISSPFFFLHFSLQLLPRLKVSEMSAFLDICSFTVFLH